jgi:hypothetical protein
VEEACDKGRRAYDAANRWAQLVILHRWTRFLRPDSTYPRSVVGREVIARDTAAFRLRKLEGFRAGHGVHVTLANLAETDSKRQVSTF